MHVFQTVLAHEHNAESAKLHSLLAQLRRARCGTYARTSTLGDWFNQYLSEESVRRVMQELEMDPGGPVRVLRHVQEHEVLNLKCLTESEKQMVWTHIAQYQRSLKH
jgi:hypothetical protein